MPHYPRDLCWERFWAENPKCMPALPEDQPPATSIAVEKAKPERADKPDIEPVLPAAFVAGHLTHQALGVETKLSRQNPSSSE